MNATTASVEIGGSEAGAVCGVDPFRSAVRVWLEKTGRAEPVEDTEAMAWGRALEPVIVAELKRRGYATRIGERIDTGAHFPWMRATLDGFVMLDGEQGVLEVKTCGARMANA